jgi:hypothetical protein
MTSSRTRVVIELNSTIVIDWLARAHYCADGNPC